MKKEKEEIHMIGISSNLLSKKIPKAITDKRYHLSVDYVKALTQAGAISCMLPILSPEDAKQVISEIDGLVLSGGNDISPVVYGQLFNGTKEDETVIERDLYEISLCKEALRQKKPILGVCRGAQLLNVVLGGTLTQDISADTLINHIQEGKPTEASHQASIIPNSQLAHILNQNTVAVNSYHHQAIQKVGKKAVVNCVSEDGVVEGIEYTGHSFALGVQWHPEIMASKEEAMASLFTYFVNETKKKNLETEAI